MSTRGKIILPLPAITCNKKVLASQRSRLVKNFAIEMLRSTHLLFSIISITRLCIFSAATDSLSPTAPLKDGQSLISLGRRFELGFFSPGDPNRRYLGIWDKQNPDVVVWVANRNNPIAGSGGILRIDSVGKLILLNQTETILWSSNSSKLAQDPVAQLLDTGNFAVMDMTITASSGNYVWQSFDHPTDTRLPGMRMGLGLNQEPENFLTSWKSPSDPSPGDFVYRVKYHGLSELVINKGSILKYRTGPWNGVRFSGLRPLNDTFVMNFRNNVMYNYYLNSNSSYVRRVVMSSSGLLDLYIYDEGMNKWTLLQTYPGDPCDNYGRCGANGFCSVVKQSSCDCLKGFIPKVAQRWELFDWSDGCVRRSPLNCSGGDRFFKLVGVKLPDMIEYWLDTNMSLRQCQLMCLNNCSCTAYANSNISQGGSGCVLWFGDLIDMTEFNTVNSQQEIYIRLAASELGSVGRIGRKRVILAVAFSIGSGTLILGLLLWCISSRNKRNIKEAGVDLLKFDPSMSLSASKEERYEVKDTKANKNDFEIPLFSFSSVSAASSNFSPSKKLGEGGFGSVYKGTLLNGDEVAIKRLATSSKQGWDELKNESVLIAKLQHKNLVKLLGCCIEGDEHIVVYEYLPNKSLDMFLFDSAKVGFLDWATRVRIIEGIAQGLLYLHQYSRLTIIHRDLKASNILLDKDLNPKISDFGLAKIYGKNLKGVTTRIVGTYGYMAPEYASEGIFSVKSDVFSFGVLLLEILSGRKNSSFHQTEFLNLLGYAWDLWTRGKALELKDVKLQEACASFDSVFNRYIQVSLLCVQQNPIERPTMSEVVLMLSNEQCLPSPKEPAFYRSLVDPSAQESYSLNVLTGSIVEAR